jgi:Nucleotide modification associated domain 2
VAYYEDMPRLYTYCIPFDDGAAPNPYWGVCTLAICKPVVRRTAKEGDWIVGTGSKKTLTGNNFSGCVVYAMEVTKVLLMEDYDAWTKTELPEKIPDVSNRDPRRRVGDSIYDFSHDSPKQRKGVHEEGNRITDLGGKNVLLSRNIFYFGNKPEPLPPKLAPIIHQTQGHKVDVNQKYLGDFLDWLNELNLKKNSLRGEPDLLQLVAKQLTGCAKPRRLCDEDDEKA